MYRVDMYYTVKTLSQKGYSKRKISKELGIHRNTVTKILAGASSGDIGPKPFARSKLLDYYKEQIETWLSQEKTAVLIHEYLISKYSVNVAYPTVVKYVRSLKHGEVYIPLLSDPGEEAQVDFGHLGSFIKEEKQVRVWVFSMILSHSRYSYCEVVLDQSVSTFIRCHIHSFEYFGGVPATVKIDNLKAGVIVPSFFEPIIQHQYASFLDHYGSTPITARICRGEDKGKIESGIKYIKNNFLKRIDSKDYCMLQPALEVWTNNICNKRLHGTTRKIPAEVFETVEKQTLLPLPKERFEIYNIEKRKTNAFGHISYQYNYYSIPYQYTGEELTIQSNGCVLKIFKDTELIAVHTISDKQGNYVTKEEHKPPYKQKKSREYYQTRINKIGPNAIIFMEELEKIRPRHWHEILRGILSLEKQYDTASIDMSCERALSYGALSYREVKSILEKKLYLQEPQESLLPVLGGYGHDLSTYDNIY
jgi:transposase